MALRFAHGRECRWTTVCCKQEWCVRRFSVVLCVVSVVGCVVLLSDVACLLLSTLYSDT